MPLQLAVSSIFFIVEFTSVMLRVTEAASAYAAKQRAKQASEAA